MNRLKCVGLIGMVFMSGVVASNNLSRLIDTNTLYEAAWYKIGVAVCIAVGCTLKIVLEYTAEKN